MIHDCFISYKSKDIDFVQSLVVELELRGLQCWYAPRDVKGEYAKAITKAIEKSKVFILILTEESAVSSHVLNEVEIAHHSFSRSTWPKIQPICTMGLDLDTPDFESIKYYIQRIHFIQLKNDINSVGIADAIILRQPCLLQKAKEREESAYIVQQIEDERLKLQNLLLKQFDDVVYEFVLGKYESCNILDVGCGNGDMLVPRVKKLSAAKFMGIDINERQILYASEKYRSKEFAFFVNDVVDKNFEETIISQMRDMEIKSFDVINISMLLLHLKEPVRLLKTLRKLISNKGTIIIRDIDDGLNFAYPDPDNTFERIYKMCEHDEQSGHRRNGRQIYHDLLKAGFSKIKLERQGLSSVGMSLSQKDALFHLYFPFTLENARVMMEKYPLNMEFREDYFWLKGKYNAIYEQFMSDDFIFSLGFISFTAQS